MKKQIEIARTIAAIILAAAAAAIIAWTLLGAAADPQFSPPELATLTPPAPYPDPYPPPVESYPAPYPAYLPYVQDGESYP